MRYAHVPVKQAVISPSALSLMYPAESIRDYSREQFIDELLSEHETEIRRWLRKGADKVQVDFTEGQLAVKIDPSGNLLNSLMDLNNLALLRFSPEERRRMGVHTCPGNDLDSTYSADVDYAELLPSLFESKARNFYVALAGERDLRHAPKIICKRGNRISGFSSESLLQSTAVWRARKKCATVRLNPARIGAGARETVNF
jgi:5-methyltetrahydropteroyltriglutamate--homocysteine methyltransferase